MKKIIYLMFITVLLLGCEKKYLSCLEETAILDSQTVELGFSIGESSDKSKVSIGTPDNGTYPVLWEDTDELFLYYDGHTTKSENFRINNAGSTASFRAIFPKEDRTSRTLCAFYPFLDTLDVNNRDLSMSLTLPYHQEPRTCGPDDNTILLWSTCEVIDEERDINLDFKHVNAYACINIPNNLAITHALVEADVPIAGDFSLSINTGQVSVLNASNSIELELGRNEGQLWFTCLPTEEMQTLTISLLLDDGKILSKTIETKNNQFKRARVSRFSLDFTANDEALYYTFMENDDWDKCDWDTGMFMSNSYYALQKYDDECEENIFLFNKTNCGSDNSSMIIACFDEEGFPASILSEDYYAELFRLANNNYDILVHTAEGVTTFSDCKIEGRIWEKYLGPQTQAAQGVSHNSYLAAASLIVNIFNLTNSTLTIAKNFKGLFSIFSISNDIRAISCSVAGLSANSGLAIFAGFAGIPASIIGLGLAFTVGSPVAVGLAVAGAVFGLAALGETIWNMHKEGVYIEYLGSCIPETVPYTKLPLGEYELGVKINQASTIPAEYQGKNYGGILMKKHKGISTGMNIYSRSDNTNVVLSFPIEQSETRTTTISAEYGYTYTYQAFITPYTETENFDTSDGQFIPKKRKSLFSTTYYGKEESFSLPEPTVRTGDPCTVTDKSATVECQFYNVIPGVKCYICYYLENNPLYVMQTSASLSSDSQEVTITGLYPGMKYGYYACAEIDGHEYYGESKYFTTAPPDMSGTYTIVDIKDTGESEVGSIELKGDKKIGTYIRNGSSVSMISGGWSYSSGSLNISIRLSSTKSGDVGENYILYAEDSSNPNVFSGNYSYWTYSNYTGGSTYRTSSVKLIR